MKVEYLEYKSNLKLTAKIVSQSNYDGQVAVFRWHWTEKPNTLNKVVAVWRLKKLKVLGLDDDPDDSSRFLIIHNSK